ncbi:MAG TPA: NEL-type E3 ubiquitin ligase domain-containing protein [Burkholderiales bacterium]|nr:NEL-type E3 ubiquitin ligase domain-containing protein [Burkholderiales bacterium]
MSVTESTNNDNDSGTEFESDDEPLTMPTRQRNQTVSPQISPTSEGDGITDIDSSPQVGPALQSIDAITEIESEPQSGISQQQPGIVIPNIVLPNIDGVTTIDSAPVSVADMTALLRNIPLPPDFPLWGDPETDELEDDINREIGQAGPLKDAVSPFLPPGTDPEIFGELEAQAMSQAETCVAEFTREQTPENEERLKSAKFEVKSLKALSRLCERLPSTESYKDEEEQTKEWFGGFLTVCVKNEEYRKANNVQFITAHGNCRDQVSDAIKALKTGYMEYQLSNGALLTYEKIQFYAERGQLETLQRVSSLEILALRDSGEEPLAVKQTLEVQVGARLRMETTPSNIGYPHRAIGEINVGRAVAVVKALEEGKKDEAAHELQPLITAAEGAVENRIRNITRHNEETDDPQEHLPMEAPIPETLKRIDSWRSGKESLLDDQLLEFDLRRTFPEVFKKRQEEVEEAVASVDSVPPNDPVKLAKWTQDADKVARLNSNWAQDLTFSLARQYKQARLAILAQWPYIAKTDENKKIIEAQRADAEAQTFYVMRPLSKLMDLSKVHPAVIEDFVLMELHIAKKHFPNMKDVVVEKENDNVDIPKVWMASQQLGLSVRDFDESTLLPNHHEQLANRLSKIVNNLPPERMHEKERLEERILEQQQIAQEKRQKQQHIVAAQGTDKHGFNQEDRDKIAASLGAGKTYTTVEDVPASTTVFNKGRGGDFVCSTHDDCALFKRPKGGMQGDDAPLYRMAADLVKGRTFEPGKHYAFAPGQEPDSPTASHERGKSNDSSSGSTSKPSSPRRR